MSKESSCHNPRPAREEWLEIYIWREREKERERVCHIYRDGVLNNRAYISMFGGAHGRIVIIEGSECGEPSSKPG